MPIRTTIQCLEHYMLGLFAMGVADIMSGSYLV